MQKIKEIVLLGELVSWVSIQFLRKFNCNGGVCQYIQGIPQLAPHSKLGFAVINIWIHTANEEVRSAIPQES